MRLRRVPGGSWGSAVVMSAVFATLAITVASAQLFLIGVGDSVSEELIVAESPEDAGLLIRTDVLLTDAAVRGADIAVVDAVAGIERLGPPELTVFGPSQGIRAQVDDEFMRGSPQLFARAGAVEAVDLIAGGPEAGVLIPESAAADLDAWVGDMIEFEGRVDTSIPIAGVYRDIDLEQLPPYWQDVPSGLLPREVRGAGIAVDGPLFIVDIDAIDEVFPSGDPPPLLFGQWEAELVDPPTTEAALRGLGGSYRSLDRRAADPSTTLGSALREAGTRSPPRVESSVSGVVADVDQAVVSAEPAVHTVRLTGVALGLAAVAGGAAFAALRRRTELELLVTEGVSTVEIGARAALAAMPWAAVGSVAGGAATPLFAQLSGPGGAAGVSDVPWAWVGVTAVAGVAVAGSVTTGVAAVVGAETSLGVRRLVRLPWDLLVYGIAVALFVHVVVQTDPLQQPQLDLLVVLFPITATAAVVLGSLRALSAASHLHLGQHRLWRRAPATLLAWRRITRGRGAAVSVLAGLAISTGLVVFSASLVDGAEAALDEKATVLVGGNVASRTRTDFGAKPPPTGTTILLSKEAEVVAGPQLELIAVDPATFSDGAGWLPRFGGSVESLMAKLEATGPGDLPVVATGPGVGPLAARGILDSPTVSFPYRIVGDLEAFPRMHQTRPTLIVRADVLEASTRTDWELGVIAEHGPVDDFTPFEATWESPLGFFSPTLVSSLTVGETEALLAEGGNPTGNIESRVAIVTDPVLNSERWGFDYFRTLMLLSLVLTLGVVALWLLARQQRLTVEFALLRRMGLSSARLVGSLGIELSAVLLGAIGIGIGTAVALLRVSAQRFDPLPEIAPPAAIVISLLGIATVIVLTSVAAANMLAALERMTARRPAGEVLRAG